MEGVLINMVNYGNAFHFNCHRKDLGLASFLLCLENDPEKCTHSLPFGNDYFCKCPRMLAFHSQKQEEIKFETASHIQSSNLKRFIENEYIKDQTGKKHVLTERRQNYRIRIDLPINFTFDTGNKINFKEGVSLDISDTGMCFYTDAPLSKGIDLQLSMKHIWESPKKSTVMWCSMITHDLYKVGVSFQ